VAACVTTPVWAIARVYVGQHMNTRGRLVDQLPPRLSLRLRAERNVRRVLGIHEAADLILSLVPRGRNAVDVGANRGIYTYWMTKRADRVDSFEPQPVLARYIRAAHLRNVHVHETALSDHAGVARLLVPGDDGLARIASVDPSDAVAAKAESQLGARVELGVRLATLDSLALADVGFLKIDAEGHELAVLQGARETIDASRPVVFVESEARHAPGAPANIIDLMRTHFGYRDAAFVRRWHLVDIEEFDVDRDQMSFLPDFRDPGYVTNFVFWP
jgi:FkbM family methyltransferase